jgi:hypothetical protein
MPTTKRYRCCYCGAELPAWLPAAQAPTAPCCSTASAPCTPTGWAPDILARLPLMGA